MALLSAIAIPNLLSARVTANETSAKTTLKAISTALETYALANGQYPASTTTLIGQAPPYLTVDFFTGSHRGYTYAATIGAFTYSVVGAPVNSSQGRYSYTMATGGVLAQNP